jgi:hypothetical protein
MPDVFVYSCRGGHSWKHDSGEDAPPCPHCGLAWKRCRTQTTELSTRKTTAFQEFHGDKRRSWQWGFKAEDAAGMAEAVGGNLAQCIQPNGDVYFTSREQGGQFTDRMRELKFAEKMREQGHSS